MMRDDEREASYGFLRIAFCELPTEAFVAAVARHALEAPDEPGSKAVAAFLRETADAGKEERLRLVAVDRARLFRGAGAPDVRVPYESVHVGRAAPDVAADLAAFYSRASLRLGGDARESPEYFGVECAFMERLLATGREALARAFFAEHVGPFGSSVAEEMRARSRTGFYRGIADALDAFLCAEARLFAEGGDRVSRVLLE